MDKRSRGTEKQGEDVCSLKHPAETSEQKKNKPSPSIPGVPSTWGNGIPAKAERWSKDMLSQVESGKQTQLQFVPAHLALKKKVLEKCMRIGLQHFLLV